MTEEVVSFEIRTLQESTAEYLEAEYGEQGRRAIVALESARILLVKCSDLPLIASAVAFCLRTALQSPGSDLDIDTLPLGKAASLLVAKFDDWNETRESSENESEKFNDVLNSVGQIKLIQQEQSRHRRRMEEIFEDRTGSKVIEDDSARIVEFDLLNREVSSAVHMNEDQLGAPEAISLYTRVIDLFESIYIDVDSLHSKLNELANLSDPKTEDLEALKKIPLVTNHLRYFLLRMKSSLWLPLLRESGLLEYPQSESVEFWLAHSINPELKKDHPDEVLKLLESIYSRVASTPQSAFDFARAAAELGDVGHDLILRCLRSEPTSFAGYVAVNESTKFPESNFVNEIADIIFEPEVLKSQTYPDPLFDAYLVGVTNNNVRSRMQTLAYKIKNHCKAEDGVYFMYSFARSPLRSDADSINFDKHLGLMNLLMDIIDSEYGLIPIIEISQLIEIMPDRISSRIVAYLIQKYEHLSLDLYQDNLKKSVLSRLPVPDDITNMELAQSVLVEDDIRQLVVEICNELPDISKVQDVISAEEVPPEWKLLLAWSPLFSRYYDDEVDAKIRLLIEAFHEPSLDDMALYPMFSSYEPISPIPLETFREMNKEEVIRSIVEYRWNSEETITGVSEVANSFRKLLSENVEEWNRTPSAIARQIIHPSYITVYTRFLIDNIETFEGDSYEHLDYVDLIFSEPWEVESIGKSTRFDYEHDWETSKIEALRLLHELADRDLIPGSRIDDITKLCIEMCFTDDLVDPPVMGNAYDSAINYTPTKSLNVLFALAASQRRQDGIVGSWFKEVLDKAMMITGAPAVAFRGMLGVQSNFLKNIEEDWYKFNKKDLFFPADNNLSKSTIAVAFHYGHPSQELYEDSIDVLWRLVDEHQDDIHGMHMQIIRIMLIGMLRSYRGFETSEVVTRLKSAGHLSDAGKQLGYLLKDEGIPREMVKVALDFWSKAIEQSTNTSISGFGFCSRAQSIEDIELVQYLNMTLDASEEQLYDLYGVSDRIVNVDPNSELLILVNKILRRKIDIVQMSHFLKASEEVLRIADSMKETNEYKRLEIAVRERRALASEE